MKTMNSMPPLKRSLALLTPWFSITADPNRVRETTTVRIDASVSVTFRVRLVAVSRAT
jgi:hypothetical protein